VLGLGVTGRSAANFCAARGARVTAVDERAIDALSGLDELHADVRILTGQAFPDLRDFDLVVPSPGIPPERYAATRSSNTQVWGDIELASRSLEIPIAAVTGTNGKTTTVSLIEAMLRSAGLRARAGGNLGTPALSLVGEALDVAILEVSSFQLETCEHFRPRVAAVLNLSADHLDRHGDFAGYKRAKGRIFANQGSDDIAVLNAAEPSLRCMAKSLRARVIWFGGNEPLDTGVWSDPNALFLRHEKATFRFPLDDFALSGEHNRENLAAALAVATALGADPAAALGALKDFRGLPHRCEVIASSGGITWINDSKATNVGAALRSLASFDRQVTWIAGGRDKGLDFGPLADEAVRRARRVLLIGEAARQIEEALGGRVPSLHCASLEEAVASAAADAREGDIVLLAPACASHDQFANFEERGECFRSAVQRLTSGERLS
jgi:UDP-N-acetylmuramoylalanine--D-glutamate ligase